MVKVYWAASLHSDKVRSENEHYARELEALGFEVLLPQRHGVWEPMREELRKEKPHLSEEEIIREVKQRCYDMDMIDLEMCDVCIMYCPRVPSEGAIFESTWCHAHGKPVFIFAPDQEVFDEINLMLTYSMERVVSMNDFKDKLYNKRTSIAVLLSGGLDSAILLHKLIKDGNKVVKAYTFDYGQIHKREIEYAEQIAKEAGVEWQLIDLKVLFKDIDSPLTPLTAGSIIKNTPYQEGGAAEVPNRNMVFLAITAMHCKSSGIQGLAYAAHLSSDGVPAYPDCSPDFVIGMGAALEAIGIKLIAPFVMDGWTKKDIVRKGKELGIDFDKTYSCYMGGNEPCGKCATCIERQQALEALND